MLDRLSSGIPDDDNRLMKFHGSYLQDDRDLCNEREKQKLEPAYQFMLRVRLTGGVATPEQWLVMDQVSDKYANGTLKITTRQTWQMHGILKWNMKNTIQEIHSTLLDTIAACGAGNIGRGFIRNLLYHSGYETCFIDEFDPDAHVKYIQKMIQRFSNPFITDEVTRVGRSPIRKLGPNDRLVSQPGSTLILQAKSQYTLKRESQLHIFMISKGMKKLYRCRKQSMNKELKQRCRSTQSWMKRYHY